MNTTEVQPNRARPLAPPPGFGQPSENSTDLDPNWLDRARCANPGVDPDIFELSASNSSDEIQRFCGKCPVRLECLVDVILVHADGGGTLGQIATWRAGFSVNALKNTVRERIKDIAREPIKKNNQSSAQELALRKLRSIYPDDYPLET